MTGLLGRSGVSDGDMIDELAELIWSAVNDVAGQSRWTWADVSEDDKQDLRNEVIEGAIRHRGDEVAEAIIAAAERTGRA